MTLARGSPLGAYRVLDALGRGGMSTVYLATRDGYGGMRKVLAIKVLDGRHAEDPRLVELFVAEARLSARANHPNVVQVLDAGRDSGRYYLVMEHLPGRSLHQLVAREHRWPRPLPLRLQLGILVQVLDGLHHLHELRDHHGAPIGVVHRDLSPENVVVSFDGAIKVIDLGLASTRNLAKGEIVGKPTYMAPEQARGELVDRRVDVFSAGVIGWELVARTRLWGALDPAEILLSLRMRSPVAALGSVVPAVDPALDAILARALRVEPDERYATCAEFADALRGYLARSIPPVGESLAGWMRDAFSVERRNLDDLVRAAFSVGSGAPAPAPAVEAVDQLTPSPEPTPHLMPEAHGTVQDTLERLCKLDGVLGAAVVDPDGLVHAVAGRSPHRGALLAAITRVCLADDVGRTLAAGPSLRSVTFVQFERGYLLVRRVPGGVIAALALRTAPEALVRVGLNAAALKLAELAPIGGPAPAPEPSPAATEAKVAALAALLAPDVGPLAGLLVRRVIAALGGPAAVATRAGSRRLATSLSNHIRDGGRRSAMHRELGVVDPHPSSPSL
ncbi:MAG: protein kinase [Myxococcota bacterium]